MAHFGRISHTTTLSLPNSETQLTLWKVADPNSNWGLENGEKASVYQAF